MRAEEKGEIINDSHCGSFLFVFVSSAGIFHVVASAVQSVFQQATKDEYQRQSESDMQFAILSIIGASDNDMSILLNVQKQTIYHRRQIVRKHVLKSLTLSVESDHSKGEDVEDIDAWLRNYVLSV